MASNFPSQKHSSVPSLLPRSSQTTGTIQSPSNKTSNFLSIFSSGYYFGDPSLISSYLPGRSLLRSPSSFPSPIPSLEPSFITLTDPIQNPRNKHSNLSSRKPSIKPFRDTSSLPSYTPSGNLSNCCSTQFPIPEV